MIRPPKNSFHEANGTLRTVGGGGYGWFFLNKGDLSKEKTAGRTAWMEEDDQHYFTCPFCLAINKAHTDGAVVYAHIAKAEPALSFIHNGRDLDSFSCEVCNKCQQHFWLTFAGAVERKIWGALKINKTKCPKCKKTVKEYPQVDHHFQSHRPTTTMLYACCGMRWK